MRKLLSLLLAVLMVVSCVPAAMFIGASAEETETPEAKTVSYTDPRDVEGAEITTYYAGTFEDTSLLPEGVQTTGSTLSAALTAYAYKTAWPKDSVLVVKFDGTEQALQSGNNTSLGRCKSLFLGVHTIFRQDGTRLPIVIEGLGENPEIVFTTPYTTYYYNANDFYCTNFTMKTVSSTASKPDDRTVSLYAGSGNIIFDNVEIASDSTSKFKFWGDNYSADAFYGWNDTRKEANADDDGLIRTSITFGKNFTYTAGTKTAPVVGAVGAHEANGATGTANYQAATNYKANYPAASAALTNDIITNVKEDAKSVIYNKGNNIVTSPVVPGETRTCIIIDTGRAASTTPDFSYIVARAGCHPVGDAQVIVNSGNVTAISPDTQTGSAAREIFCGDITIEINGGNVIECVNGLYYAHVIGDYTINLNGGTVKRINGAEGVSANTSIANGNFLFHMTGGEITTYYYGSCGIFGTGTCTNRIEGGTICYFYGSRYDTTTLINEISGGTFTGNVYAGSPNDSKVNTITNNISGDYNATVFNKAFYTSSAKNTNDTVTTNISGGQFLGTIAKGGATVANHSINVISEKATDAIKFQNVAFTFDKFEMNGGTVHFYKSTVTAENASGSVIVRNTGAWETGKTYFTFTPAQGKDIAVTTTQHPSVPTRGRVITEGGKYLVVADTRIAPVGASLVLTERIAVKFVFKKADVDAIGKDNFEASVLLNNVDIAAGSQLVENGENYTLTTLGIGLADANTQFTLCGEDVQDAGYSIASLADAAIAAWETSEPDWATWAKALKNMIAVAVNGQANAITPADKDYDTFTAGGNRDIVTSATAGMVMNSAVGAEVELGFNGLPANPVVKVNGKVIEGVYTTEGNVATITIYFAPQAMEKTFTLQLLDGKNVLFTLEASVACLAKALNSDAGNALLAYVQATTAVAGK